MTKTTIALRSFYLMHNYDQPTTDNRQRTTNNELTHYLTISLFFELEPKLALAFLLFTCNLVA